MSKPETKKDIQDLRAIRKSLKTRLERMKKEDPDFATIKDFKSYLVISNNIIFFNQPTKQLNTMAESLKDQSILSKINIRELLKPLKKISML